MNCPYCSFTARQLSVVREHMLYAHDNGRAAKTINLNQVNLVQIAIIKDTNNADQTTYISQHSVTASRSHLACSRLGVSHDRAISDRFSN